MKLSGVERFHMACEVNVCFFALKTCGFLEIALNNSQTRRPKLTRRSTQLRTSQLRPLLWFFPRRQRRASMFLWEWIMFFLWDLFLFNRGPRGGNGGSWGQRSIERVPSSCSAWSCHRETKKGRYEFCRSSLFLLLPHDEQTRLPDSPHLYVWQPVLWQFRLMKEDFS